MTALSKVFEKGVISFMSQTWDKEKKGKSPMGWKPLTSQSTARVSNSLPERVGRNQSCEDQERITCPVILSLVRTQWTSCSFSPKARCFHSAATFWSGFRFPKNNGFLKKNTNFSRPLEFLNLQDSFNSFDQESVHLQAWDRQGKFKETNKLKHQQ